MPDATPRYRAGTLLMTEDEFGAANRPPPIPFAHWRGGSKSRAHQALFARPAGAGALPEDANGLRTVSHF
jgi:hypothetical protein